MTTPTRSDLRNIAIIAHVDHGKTTLVDAMLKQTGTFRENEAVADRVMDSNDLERERGITILAKNASILYKGVRINIIDTPGHADFGGEVERTISMADGVLLLVDAAEGPLPQTRFVLGKALELGIPVIVVINKIDRPDARPDEVLTETFDLFCELEANEGQLDFPTVYTIAKLGQAKLDIKDEGTNLVPLLETILTRVPEPRADVSGGLQVLVTNVEHDEYVGRLAVGRIKRGKIKLGEQVMRLGETKNDQFKVSQLYGMRGVKRTSVEEAGAGDVALIAGSDEIQIGDTITSLTVQEALPRIVVEEPTIKVRFQVNSSPMAGRSGKWVTSRHLRDRLEREMRKNLAMKMEETDTPDAFMVYGRGELMIAILLENMRREGYEVAVSMPEVVTKEVDGQLSEPVERVVIDVPDEYVGAITQRLGERRGRMDKMHNLGFGRSRVEYVVPSRGLIGFRGLFLTDTRGTGLLNTQFHGWQPYSGLMQLRPNGAMVSDRQGTAIPYALFNLQPRGEMFVNPGVDVYEGMIIGEHNRANDLDVNACREKKLTNIRAAGRDENIILTPPRALTIETAMEWIDSDELVEITPDAIRIRKKILECSRRPKRPTAD
ncbi:MAG TPA: translational GTPase TypA [Polyangiales bacterium]|nr:translational GTPase TypA [Polyangiales bacterium]